MCQTACNPQSWDIHDNPPSSPDHLVEQPWACLSEDGNPDVLAGIALLPKPLLLQALVDVFLISRQLLQVGFAPSQEQPEVWGSRCRYKQALWATHKDGAAPATAGKDVAEKVMIWR